MSEGFSLSSVILSYLLVGGGLCTGTLVLGLIQPGNQYVGYGLLAAGSFVGGWVAARASRGSTIIEPAIGAVAVVGTIVALVGATEVGRHMWNVAHDETMKFVGLVGLTSAGGALVGAFLSEKLLGEATTSGLPWVIYTAMAAFGACMLATILSALAIASQGELFAGLATTVLIGAAVGCFLAGAAVGASARTRPLLAAFLGGGLGVAGFFYLVSRGTPATRDLVIGIAVLGGMGAVITMVGALLGWSTAGQRG